MAIRSIMHKDLVIIGPGDTVAVAAQRLAEHALGALLVMEGDKLFGIFSERDLVTRVVALGKDPSKMLVGEVATKDPVTVVETAGVEECYRIIKEHGFRHLPIISASGAPVGIISARDFFQLMVVSLSQTADMGELFKNIGKMRIDPRGV